MKRVLYFILLLIISVGCSHKKSNLEVLEELCGKEILKEKIQHFHSEVLNDIIVCRIENKQNHYVVSIEEAFKPCLISNPYKILEEDGYYLILEDEDEKVTHVTTDELTRALVDKKIIEVNVPFRASGCYNPYFNRLVFCKKNFSKYTFYTAAEINEGFVKRVHFVESDLYPDCSD